MTSEELPLNLVEWFRLECIALTADLRMHRIDGATCDDIELVLCVKMRDRYLTFVNAELDPVLAGHVLSLPAKGLFTSKGASALRDLLYEETDPLEVRREVTYQFDSKPAVPWPDVIALGDTAETLETFAVLEKGRIVSKAWSVRRVMDHSAQIAVNTVEEYLNHGFATQCAAAWADYQLSQGKVAIYSHRVGNEASRALAKALGLTPFAEVISYY